ncbi:MAG TPA: hypothetical protein VG755_30195 [Nannocystaceae bacterium]|nr:hypothetical protein [Nannocystaceae bacterium]
MRGIAVCALLTMVGCFSESDVGGSDDDMGTSGTSNTGTGMTSSSASSSSTTATSSNPSESSTIDPDTGSSSHEDGSTTLVSTTTSTADTSGELDSSASASSESGPTITCPPGECASCVMCAFQGPCMAQHVECMDDDTGPCPEILDCAMTCLGAGDPVDCLANTCMCSQSDLAYELVMCVVQECPTSCPMFEC